ncbi:hypothetical protein [Methylophilus sp. UBA6697]|uniref:hypothetical protein n=1 Tax=Methylophilus sp. UBA6697 TaxID=1946902 RepID=UPI0025CC2E38|nr:hypothetical protein [Methylophilus sp. UBA6697]
MAGIDAANSDNKLSSEALYFPTRSIEVSGGVMSVNSINAYSAYQTQSVTNWQQVKQGVKSLNSALKSGDLQAAKDAFSSLSQAKNIGSNSPLGKIGEALQKDDIKSALQVINPAQTSSTNETTPLAWQQLAKLVSSTDATENAVSVSNKVSSLLNYLSSGDAGTASISTKYTPGIINQVLSEISSSNSASTKVSLGASASTETTELYSQLAQQIKNNPHLGALLVERLKAQSSNGVFSYL